MSRNLDQVPLKDWEFSELQAAATWIVIHGLTTGIPINSLVHQALQLALRWKAEKTP